MNNRNIIFSDFKISTGSINFLYSDNIVGDVVDENRIFFNLSKSIIPQTDLIAIAISTLCAKKYSTIHYELNVSQSVLNDISNFTSAKVTASSYKELYSKRKKSNNVTLNFSGGFDSLSSKYLMPADTRLVSMDFGGRFSRERDFFENFDTCVVSTNLLETPLKENTWSFMGIASILYSDYLETDFQTFGSILEASPNNFSDNPIAANNISFPPFKAAKMENAPYVLGLTEIGTIKVLGHYAPELISPSLDSLASPGEEKRYRKQVLAMIFSEKTKIDLGLNILKNPPKPHFKFGENFASDFLSFYIIKNAGIDIASHTISNIPEEVIDLSNRLSLNFYERINPNFIVNFPKTLLNELMYKLTTAGIIPYSQNDWKEFFQVRKTLSKYHTI